MSSRTVIVVEPDPYLAVTVEALLSDVHPQPELVAVADLEELLDWARPTGVVICGPSTAGRTAIEELGHFRDLHPAVRIVLAWDRRPGAAMRDIVTIGADALVDPSDAERLRHALGRALTLADALADSVARAAQDDGDPLGRVYTVCSATGGCGKTFFATNAALTLSRFSGGRVALIDLDLQFGEVMTTLRLRAQHTIADAIAVEDDAELTAYLPELMTAHESGVWVLPAPSDPAEADRIEPSDILRIIDAARRHFDHVIVDTPTGLGEPVLAAFDRSEHLFVMAALDLPSVRNLRLFLQTLDRLHIPRDDVSVLLNKDQTDVGLETAQVEKLFPRGFLAKIPFSRDVPRSMNLGVPLVVADPTSEVARRLTRGLLDFLPEAGRDAAERELGPERTSLLRRWFGTTARPLARPDRVAALPTGGKP